MKTKEEKFILKEDGLIYWIENCPVNIRPLHAAYWSTRVRYNEALQSAIDSAVEVGNQKEVFNELCKHYPMMDNGTKGKIYSLECSVEKKEYCEDYAKLDYPFDCPFSGSERHKKVALVTFPQSKEDNPIRTKEEEIVKAADDYSDEWISFDHQIAAWNGFIKGAKWMESQFSSSYRSGEESKPDQP